MLDINELGQVFTPEQIVKQMISLIKNKDGKILEPSSGNGAFYNKLIEMFEDVKAIEIDKTVAHQGAIIGDFFDEKPIPTYDTIIGNPPYVRFQNIPKKTKRKLDMDMFDSLSNFYLFFIKHSIDLLKNGGELIFIVPRDFIKATSARELNEYIYKNGTITHFEDMGSANVFKDANPNTVIFRFEKGLFDRDLDDGRKFICQNGQLYFLKNLDVIPFSDLFYVKVGAASGCNSVFAAPGGNKDFVYSGTNATGKTKKMHYNLVNEHTLKHKEKLMDRKIKQFNESNWYMWGRDYYHSPKKRIYVNLKTRNKNPFFLHDCKAYDGSVLAIFPLRDYTDEQLKEIVKLLNNNVDWEELGFYSDGRFMFNQRSLENTLLPNIFTKYI